MTFLEELEALLEDERAWTKHSSARDEKGNSLMFGFSERAVSWCLGGGISCVYVRRNYPVNERLYAVNALLNGLLRRGFITTSFADFNDDPNTTYADVMDLIREAKTI